MSSQERAQEQKELGNSALKEHRYKDAIKFYSLALDINPDNTAALFNKTIAYIKMDDWENAVNHASLCLDRDVTNTKALYHRGYSLMNLERYKEALVDFERALSLQPPTDQITALQKKIDVCNKVLSSESNGLNSTLNDEVLAHHMQQNFNDEVREDEKLQQQTLDDEVLARQQQSLDDEILARHMQQDFNDEQAHASSAYASAAVAANSDARESGAADTDMDFTSFTPVAMMATMQTADTVDTMPADSATAACSSGK